MVGLYLFALLLLHVIREELECIGVLGEPVFDKSDGVEHEFPGAVTASFQSRCTC